MELQRVDVVSVINHRVLDRPSAYARAADLMREVMPGSARSRRLCEAVVPKRRTRVLAGATTAGWWRDDEFYDEGCSPSHRRCCGCALPQPWWRVRGATAAGCRSSPPRPLAADTATFATPGVRIGLFCSTPMVPLRAIGRKRRSRCCSQASPRCADRAGLGSRRQVVPIADSITPSTAVSKIPVQPRVIGLGRRSRPDRASRAVRTARPAGHGRQRRRRRRPGHRRIPRETPAAVARALTGAAPSHRPTCASRWRAVECTGSLSNSGSTNLPKVSTDSIAAAKGVSSDSEPNDT